MYKVMTSRRILACLLAIVVLAGLVLSCGTTRDVASVTPQAEFDRAVRRYEAKRYVEATEQFKALLVRFPGSKYAEPATFFLGQSCYKEKDYLTAEVEFERIIRDFPRGSYAEEAAFMLAMCACAQRRPAAYDQSAAEKAVRLLRTYLATYPEGAFSEQAQEELRKCRSLLAEKLHANGVLYLKLHDPRAARLSFEEVLEKYGDLHWADWALVGIAKSYEQERDWAKAIELYKRVVKRDGDAEALDLARGKVRKLREKTGQSGNTG